MTARFTLASVALVLLTLPALLAPAQAYSGIGDDIAVSVRMLQAPTIAATGLAQATLVNTTTGLPLVGEFVHVTIAYGPVPGGVVRSSIVQQVAAKTDANGVATFALPFDQTAAKINEPGRHVLTAFLDGTPATANEAYQVGTGLV